MVVLLLVLFFTNKLWSITRQGFLPVACRFVFEKAKELGIHTIIMDGPDRWVGSMDTSLLQVVSPFTCISTCQVQRHSTLSTDQASTLHSSCAQTMRVPTVDTAAATGLSGCASIQATHPLQAHHITVATTIVTESGSKVFNRHWLGGLGGCNHRSPYM